MDLNDERDDEKDDMAYDPHRDHAMPREGHVGGLDPLDITNPASAYLFLSDDAQDEISGSDKKNEMSILRAPIQG